MTVFIFETPTQDEVADRLGALDEAKHTGHTTPARFCRLCPPVPARSHPADCITCGGTGITVNPKDAR